MILSIDTSTLGLSMALAEQNKILIDMNLTGDKPCGERIIDSFDKMLGLIGRKPKNLKRIILTTGPGSFTGLRIGMTFAKALWTVNQVELKGIDSHYPVAWRLRDFGRNIIITQDARKGQIYASGYRAVSEDILSILPIRAWDPKTLISHLPPSPMIICGTGIDRLKPNIPENMEINWLTHPWWYSSLARTLIYLENSDRVKILDPVTAVPQYFRESQAQTGR